LGDSDYKLKNPNSELWLARFIKFSGDHKLNNRWALLGTAGWEDWRALKQDWGQTLTIDYV
jgi:hypothetical protein